MLVNDFDYNLPEELIAQRPAEPRDHSRLMVIDRASGKITHDYFYNLLKYTDSSDQFVFNDTKVIPARLYGMKKSGGKVEVLLLSPKSQGQNPNVWEFIGKNIGRAKEIIFENDILGEIRGDEIEFNKNPLDIGEIPLPPYIKSHGFEDKYQTVYAKVAGSAAAPTAGLHFTKELFGQVPHKSFITLNVGLGTFQPLKKEVVEENVLHTEYYDVGDFAKSGNIVAVGTTTVRVLETFANTGKVAGETNIFIYPGYKFRMVNKLITNFHLPKSSLLMLVCAFGGKDLIMRTYEEAVKEKYRFFSFGDAMLII